MSSGGWAIALEQFKEHLRDDERTYLSGKPAGPRTFTTRESYLSHVRWVSEGVEAGPWEVTSSELASWLGAQNWSRSTRKKVLVSLRTFYAWGVSSGRLEWAPTAGLPSAENLRQRGPTKRRWPATWAGPVEEFVAALRGAGRAETTVGAYLARLRLLADLAADPWTITEQQLAQWLSNPDWSHQTRRNYQVAAAAFYKWGQRRGHVAVSPAAHLPAVRVPRSIPRPAAHDLVREAIAAADDRTRLAILLAVDAGLRCAEIAGMHTNQVASTHLLVIGKGGHQRVVPMDPEGDLALALRTELERRRRGEHGTGWRDRFVNESGYLFPSDLHPGPITPHYLSKLMSRALGEATAHTLRHRFATDAYLVERDLQAVQQLLGHAKPETTAVYAQVPDGAMLAAVRGANARRHVV